MSASPAPSANAAVAPAGLTQTDIARLQARLREKAGDLAATETELRSRLAAEESATANTFVAGIEGAMASESDDEVIALLQHERAELAATREALERIERGAYGFCIECGDSIGLPRLEVVPDARLCVGCQDMAEHRRGR